MKLHQIFSQTQPCIDCVFVTAAVSEVIKDYKLYKKRNLRGKYVCECIQVKLFGSKNTSVHNFKY